MHLADLKQAKLEIKRFSDHISNLCLFTEAAKPLAKNEAAKLHQSLITQLRDLLQKSRIFMIHMHDRLESQIDRMSEDKLQDLLALWPLMNELQKYQSQASETLRLYDEEKHRADHPEERPTVKALREARARLAAAEQEERDKERLLRRQSKNAPHS